MRRITVKVEDEARSRLFDSNDEKAMEGFRKSGAVIEDRVAHEGNDAEVFEIRH